MLVAENLPYYQTPPDDYASEHCTVNVHRPAQDQYPVFVYFHGGGLEGGSRSEGDDFTTRMLAEGFGVVSVHYRLHPRAQCPAYLQDAAMAIAWTLEHIQDYGGDPKKVFITGHSAGGYLTAMMGLAEQFLAATGHHTRELLGIIPSSGQMLTHFTIRREHGIPMEQAVIDEYAPLHYAHTAKMPMLLIVGGDDMAMRVEENALMYSIRKANGHEDTQLLVVPGRDHCTIHHAWTDATDPVALATIAFVRRLVA
jgi:acetyl esterase/lipase